MIQNKDRGVCKLAVKIQAIVTPAHGYYCSLNKDICKYSLKVPGFNGDEGIFCVDEYQNFRKKNEALN